ncbi:MAG: hypothetical protein ACOX7I_00175 [Oscillospiraceae bacterium]
MKKLTALLMSFTIFSCFTACVASPAAGKCNKISVPAETVDPDRAELLPPSTDEDEELAVEVEEELIFDQDDIKITVVSLNTRNFLYGPELNMAVENNSRRDITLQARSCAVNGAMVEAVFSCDVPAGEKARDSIIFLSESLEEAGIKTIKNIEFRVCIFDTESWATITQSDIVTLTTTADPSFKQKFDDSGEVLLRTRGYKIVVKRLERGESLWGANLVLYMENKTDEYAVFQVRDVHVNGSAVPVSFSREVLPGKVAFAAVKIYKRDLDKAKIREIKEIMLTFRIANAEDYVVIMDSEPMLIKFH